MALKDKAKKSSSSGKLGQQASARGFGKMETKEDPAEHNQLPSMPGTFNQSPPPPPSMQYMRYFSTIPSLRKNTNGQGIQ
jgi:hypothetical protein